jgi:hypothetical protein
LFRVFLPVPNSARAQTGGASGAAG